MDRAELIRDREDRGGSFTARGGAFVHALAIGLAILRPDPMHAGSAAAPWLFTAGIVLFSGSLYAMTLTGRRVLGAITPLGGLLFLAGWGAILFNALRVVD